MKKPGYTNGFLLLTAIFIVSMLNSCTNGHVILTEVTVDAPFNMPVIHVPDFSRCKAFPITDYGAIEGEKEKTSKAIAQAIYKASARGGGIVIIPEGEWLSGKVHLKSNVNLHLEEGAVLLFSDDPQDYLPEVLTSWEGMECYNYSPLIYAFECSNIAITGNGKLEAKMDTWKDWFGRPPAHMNSLKRLYTLASEGSPVEERNMVNDSSHLRPHFIQFNRCENILLEGVSIRNSPFWTIHPYLCKDVVIRNINVYAHGHNNDGVDPEMSSAMLIENCYFDQGDDAIAVKSGRNQDAWRLNTPTRNLLIRNCTVKNGHQLLAIGSELSGGIENVCMENCRVEDGASMYHLLFIKTNERRGGYVKNIHMRNIQSDRMREGILGIETDVLYQWRNLAPTYEKRLTPISGVHMDNIEVREADFISRIQGQEELPVSNVELQHIKVSKINGQPLRNINVHGFVYEE